MAPYEALYGRKCRSPLHWDLDDHKQSRGDNREKMLQPELVQEAIDKVHLYAKEFRLLKQGRRVMPITEEEIWSFLLVIEYFLRFPQEGNYTVRKRNKLKPRIHDVFHVSHLKKYYPDPSHILQPDTVELEEDLSYQERPIRILDKKIQELRNRRIPLVKVLWQNHGVEEATWEREDELRRNHPELFNEPTGEISTLNNRELDNYWTHVIGPWAGWFAGHAGVAASRGSVVQFQFKCPITHRWRLSVVVIGAAMFLGMALLSVTGSLPARGIR
ncbi:UNVERIFIED_CONTAM: hypothetical protein Sradi_3001000 [Sesamum radiatum]|uniref:Chromo domain-containing protein n=1 Tax=Sesamum radiatum TaxID=300843 RepID=A0AAW2S135_SESRA